MDNILKVKEREINAMREENDSLFNENSELKKKLKILEGTITKIPLNVLEQYSPLETLTP